MTISITLNRSAQSQVINPGASASYRFTVQAVNGNNVPNEIFKMNQRPLDPIAQTVTDDFVGVCTPFDLQSLPINAPLPPNTFFRVSFIDVTYETTTVGDDIWQEIKDNVKFLLDSLAANASLIVSESVTIVS